MKHLKCYGKHMVARHLAVLQYFSVGDISKTVTRGWSRKQVLASAVLWCARDDLTALGFPMGRQWTGTIMQTSWKTHLRGAMRKKRPDLLKKQWILLQDNARPHIAAVVLAALTEIGGTALKYSPYSPDLAPCDFWAFPTLKRQLRGKRFSSYDEVRNTTAAVLKGMSQNNLFHVFESFMIRCKKCIQHEGRYLEKGKKL